MQYAVSTALAAVPGCVPEGGARNVARRDGVGTVGVTAGASAPEIVVQGVVSQLTQWGGRRADEVAGREEHVVFALPRELRQAARRVDSLSSDPPAG